ncbi:hypothetical protein [Fusobacterium sp. PH5-44]|uniref:toxin-antitoxin system YwqK family antitoxin n=1 Tax=unclassified Fusobacterium TaxID=2648384 RepID=UPI003D1F5FD5
MKKLLTLFILGFVFIINVNKSYAAYKVMIPKTVNAVISSHIYNRGGFPATEHEKEKDGEIINEVKLPNGEIKDDGLLYQEKLSKPFTGIANYYSDNNEYLGKYTFKAGIKNGPYTEYYDNNGTLYKIEGQYINGKKEGMFFISDTDGFLTETGIYIDNNKADYFVKYNKDESIEEIHNPENLNISGEYKTTHLNGQLKKQGKFLNGKREGKFYHYDYDKRLISFVEYKNNIKDGPYSIDNRDDCFVEEGVYINNSKEGNASINEYSHDIDILIKFQYKNNMKNGEFSKFFFGKIWEKGTYVNDVMEGPYQVFLDGKLSETGTYVNDQKEGPYKELSNGKFVDAGVHERLYYDKLEDEEYDEYNDYEKYEREKLENEQIEKEKMAQEIQEKNKAKGIPDNAQERATYYTNGALESKGIYNGYSYIGEYFKYYDNGNLKEHSIRDMNDGTKIVGNSIEYNNDNSIRKSIIYTKSKTNQFRVDKSPNLNKIYITSGQYSSKQLSPFIYSLTKIFDSEIFITIQDHLILIMIIPFLIIMLILNHYRKKWADKFLKSAINNDSNLVCDKLRFNLFEQFYPNNYSMIEIISNDKKESFQISDDKIQDFFTNTINQINNIYLNNIVPKEQSNNISQIKKHISDSINNGNIDEIISYCINLNNLSLINKINILYIKLFILLSLVYFLKIIGIFTSIRFLVISLAFFIVMISILMVPIKKFFKNKYYFNNLYQSFYNSVILENTGLHVNSQNIIVKDSNNFTGSIHLRTKEETYNKEFLYKNGVLDGNQTMYNKDSIKIFSTFYKTGINIGPFNAYELDRKSPIYLITKDKNNYSIKINNFSFTESELISYVRSNQIEINSHNNKVYLGKDKIEILNTLFEKFNLNFSNIIIIKNYLDKKYRSLIAPIIITCTIAGITIFYLKTGLNTPMPEATIYYWSEF